jgi:glutamate-1-semialdehyde 2,1-aminomutase
MPTSRPVSAKLFEQARRCIPGGVNSPVRAFAGVGGMPVYIQEADGSRITDADGYRYVDFCQSWGPLILGHSHPAIVEAVRAAACRGLSYGACHEGEIRCAELVLQGCPGFNMVRFVNSGTEAVMTSLRLARAATGRDLIVKFDGGYHGHVDSMLVRAGSGLATHGIASSSGVPSSFVNSTLVAPFDDDQALRSLFANYGDHIAALIIEPLPANNGLLPQRTEFLNLLRELTSAHGALLIFDEVISGFRLCYGGYFQRIGITPDLLTMGKIIGGGMPVGAVVGPQRILSLLSPHGPVYQAGTLSGNPVSLAAGCATLSLLQRENPYDRLASLGSLFCAELASAELPACRAVSRGSLVWMYLDDSPFPRTPAAIVPDAVRRFNGIHGQLLDIGYYLPPSAYEVLFLSTAHTEDEVRGCARAIVSLLSEQARNGKPAKRQNAGVPA